MTSTSGTSGSNGSNRINTSSLKTIVLQSTAVVTKFISNLLVPKVISSRIVGSSGIGGSSGSSGSVPTNWSSDIKLTLNNLIGVSKDRRLFSKFTQSNFSWVRNSDSWVKSYNWTGVSAGINGLGGVGGGTLITNKHVLLSAHVPYLPNSEIFFVNGNNKTFKYIIVKIEKIADSDIAIGTLDRSADNSLKIYSVLPDNWQQYIKFEIGNAMGIKFTTLKLPVLFLNQDRKVSTGEMTKIVVNSIGSVADVYGPDPTFDAAQSYYETQRGGDSGNPIFVQVGSEVVLLGAWYRVASFAWLLGKKTEVESIIGQKLNVINMDKFIK
jgi:hypothetical protein